MILLHGLLFLTPFIFSTHTNELFEFPKMYFVYLAGSVLIVLAFLNRRLTLYLPINLAGLFVAGYILSTLFSLHRYTSVWGYFSRFNGGLVSVGLFFGIYLSILYLKPQTNKILKTVSLTLVPISVYAVMQHFGLGGNWASDTTIRAFATFGQPNWYGAYGAMVLPVVLYFILTNKDPRRNKLAWIGLFILGFSGFWFAYSISGLLGLAAAIGLVIILNLNAAKANLPSLLALAAVCLTIGLLNPGLFAQKAADAFTDLFPRSARPTVNSQIIKETVPLVPERPEPATTYALTDSGFIRKNLWKGSLALATASTKNFVIGTGPETFPTVFQKYRPAALNQSSEWAYILNKPHNYYLELLSQNGLIGLILYAALIIRGVAAKHSALSPALLGLFVTNCFGWPTVATALLFWTFLALIPESGPNCKLQLPPAGSLSVYFLILVTLSYLNSQFGKQYLADVKSKTAESYFDRGNIPQALAYSHQAVKLNPYEPYYYRQRAKTYILATVGQSPEVVNHVKDQALHDLLKAQELNPQNPATLRGEIPLYYFLALNNLAASAESRPQDNKYDPDYLELAGNYYQELAQLFPTDVGVQAQIAKYQKMLDLMNDYQKTTDRIRSLRPDLLDWYLN